MLVGEVRCAIGQLRARAGRCPAAGRDPRRRRTSRSTATSSARRAGDTRGRPASSAARRLGTGRLSAYAIARRGRPQREHRQRRPAAPPGASSDDQRPASPTAISGLAIISVDERAQARRPAAGGAGRRRLPLEQPALGDAEAHQRHGDRVQPSRTPGWRGRRAAAPTRAASVCRSSTAVRRNARHDCQPRAARASSSSSAQTRPGTRARARRDRRPRDRACPAARSSRARAAATVAGAIRLRRRLSRIFQRDDERQAIALQARARRHERKQPPQDLPVAAHPAVLAPRVREDARRIVVHDLDVGDQRRARVEALEQVVRQQRVLRHAALERRRRTRRRRRGPCR